jgi:hypothetical protein
VVLPPDDVFAVVKVIVAGELAPTVPVPVPVPEDEDEAVCLDSSTDVVVDGRSVGVGGGGGRPMFHSSCDGAGTGTGATVEPKNVPPDASPTGLKLADVLLVSNPAAVGE